MRIEFLLIKKEQKFSCYHMVMNKHETYIGNNVVLCNVYSYLIESVVCLTCYQMLTGDPEYDLFSRILI